MNNYPPTPTLQELIEEPDSGKLAQTLELWAICVAEQMMQDLNSEEMVEELKKAHTFGRDDMQVWVNNADEKDRDDVLNIILDYNELVLDKKYSN